MRRGLGPFFRMHNSRKFREKHLERIILCPSEIAAHRIQHSSVQEQRTLISVEEYYFGCPSFQIYLTEYFFGEKKMTLHKILRESSLPQIYGHCIILERYKLPQRKI